MWRCLLSGLLCAACIPKAGNTSAESAASAEEACARDGVVDDGEDNDHRVIVQKGRGGYLYTFSDKLGTTVTPPKGAFVMSQGGAHGSAFAAHATGKITQGETVYAGVGLSFVDPKGPYDASAYRGIAFWAKVGPGAATKVRLKFPDANTDPDGKVCSECFNDFGFDLELTTTWERYVVPFASMQQLPGWGAPRPAGVEVSKVFGVQWQVNTPGALVDIWVDDIEFTGCS